MDTDEVHTEAVFRNLRKSDLVQLILNLKLTWDHKLLN